MVAVQASLSTLNGPDARAPLQIALVDHINDVVMCH